MPASRPPGGKTRTKDPGGTPILGALAVLILAAGIAYRVMASRESSSVAPVEPKSNVIRLGPIAPPAPTDTGDAEASLPPPPRVVERPLLEPPAAGDDDASSGD